MGRRKKKLLDKTNFLSYKDIETGSYNIEEEIIMPTYLYECENCGRFEEFQKISDSPLEKCPECGGKTKRIIGKPGIIFKGSGFYSTDNPTDSSRDNKKVSDTQNNSSENDNQSNDKKKSSDKQEKVS